MAESPILYSPENQPHRAFLAVPQLVRWRHRFRGTRESYKINLESDQIRFDTHRLCEKYNELTILHKAQKTIVIDGGELEDITFREDDATPTDEAVVLVGLEALSQRVQRLKDRITNLERNESLL
ncbi:MAG TPA: hypothetical protein VJ742_12135 [Nitrososphaera sp.]|nr:hypothetical protein [Nitrososphaera sp.]